MKVRLSQMMVWTILLGFFFVFPIRSQAEPSVTVEQKDPAVTVAPKAPRVSPAIAEIVKLHKAGVDPSIVQAFIEACSQSFGATADDIIYMQNEGVTNTVVMTILKHDAKLLEQSLSMGPPDIEDGADAAEVVEFTPTYVENPPEEVATFYNDLAPHGSWIYLEDQGWCWQPNVVRADASWEPYLDNGRWLYSDAGWYWDSDYSWGWAPFHYGRWWNAPVGWVWFPDTVWAPSWATWRYSDRYCGWAATSPSFFPGRYGLGLRHFGFGDPSKINPNSYAFVGSDQVFAHNLRPHRMGGSEAQGIYNRTVPGNTPFSRDNIVVNQGAPIAHVTKASGKTVSTVPISNVRVDPKSTRPGVQKSGDQNVIAVPKLTTPTRFTGMVAQRVTPKPEGTRGVRGLPVQEPAGAVAPGPPEVFPWNGPSRRGSGFESPGQNFGPDRGFGPGGVQFDSSGSRFGPQGGIDVTPRIPQGYAPGPTPRIPVTAPSISPPPIGAASTTPSIPGSPSFSPRQSYVPRNPSFGSGHQSFRGGSRFGSGAGSAGTPGFSSPPSGGNRGPGGSHPTGGPAGGGPGGAGR